MTNIISPLPFTLTNGTTADASQVQADLDAIRNDVNVQVPLAISGAGSYRGCLCSVDVGNISIGSDTETIINFADEIIDTDAIHNSSISESKFFVPAGVSLVRLFFNIVINSQPAGDVIQTRIYTGAFGHGFISEFTYTCGNSVNGAEGFTSCTPVISCTPGESFQLFFRSPNGSSVVRHESQFELQILG